MAMDTARRLKEKGEVQRAWLGVHIQRVTPDLAEATGLPVADGAVVVNVVEGSPARKAGMEKGDVIISYGGRKLHRASDLPYLVSRSPVGEPVAVEVIRSGKRVILRPVLEKYPLTKKEE